MKINININYIIFLFFFCFFAFLVQVTLHESAHYIAAKFANMTEPQFHYASITVKDPLNFTLPLIEIEKQFPLMSLLAFKSSGIIISTIISIVSIYFLSKRYSDYWFIFGVTSFVRIYYSVIGLTAAQISGDELFTAKLLAYFTPWWDNMYLVTILFLVILYLEFLITFYLFIAALKSRKIWQDPILIKFPGMLTYPITIAKIVISYTWKIFRRGITDEERKKKLPLALEIARLFALFVMVYFWSLLWFYLVGPAILP